MHCNNAYCLPSSFRDPSGFLFRSEDGTLYRQVNTSYKADYSRLMGSGLYKELAGQRLLVEHAEVSSPDISSANCHCVLRPRELPFISYPYEWCFSELKDAALLTLDIQLRAMTYGMYLKDASAYNVQFDGPRPVFIDTLSFESCRHGMPWPAYGQFCRHFLAPLALMCHTDVQLNRLLELYLDGVPLDLASRLLPVTTRLRPGLLAHIHVLAKMVARYSGTSQTRQGVSLRRKKAPRVSSTGVDALVKHIRRVICRLHWRPKRSEWMDYYDTNSYDHNAFKHKCDYVRRWIAATRPRLVWDLGANTGTFSQIAATCGAYTCAFDIDPACVELNYASCKTHGENLVLPLLLDITNPSPGCGWAHNERDSLLARGPADLVLALALVHHLAIASNLPFGRIAGLFHSMCRSLIIEYVPKSDPQAQRLLQSREDIFTGYDQPHFEKAFLSRFYIVQSQPLGNSGRVVYLMRARQ